MATWDIAAPAGGGLPLHSIVPIDKLNSDTDHQVVSSERLIES